MPVYQDPIKYRQIIALLFIGEDTTMLSSSDFGISKQANPKLFELLTGFSVLNAVLSEKSEHVFVMEYPDNGPLAKFDRETDQWEFPIKGAKHGLKILIGTNNEIDFQGSWLSIKRDGDEHVKVTFAPGPNVPDDTTPTMLGYAITVLTEFAVEEGVEPTDAQRKLVE